ncbi:sugar ABC transporter permease [Mesoplasma chauliocola]|uniref:Sugar ABC transporter permease n=1 Tax=Mesoplasma chauliocola TaxID=216427 RepID=A0A249SMD2_9MOLU|nr:sugar ABC transporter permease [Mesoplasma chauliocola]ASZ08780.1 sugar ABC transporter permease [Mesoplasma chauliocola]
MKKWDKGFIINRTNLSKKNANNLEKGRFDIFNQLIWILPAFFFICVFSYFSIYIVFKFGLSENGGQGVFKLSFTSIKNLFTDPLKEFPIALRNTLLYVTLSVPISLLLSLWVGKSLSNVLNKKAFAFFQSALFLPYVTSSLAVAMAFSMIFSNSGNSLLAQLLSKFGLENIDWTKPKNAITMTTIFGIWRMLPFQIILFTAAFLKVDKRLYQAAAVDGIPRWQQYWKISIPQIMPVIVYMITTSIIGSLKFIPFGLFADYDEAVKASAQTAVYYIFAQINTGVGSLASYSKAGAAAIILMLIILVITIFNAILSKYLRKKFR